MATTAQPILTLVPSEANMSDVGKYTTDINTIITWKQSTLNNLTEHQSTSQLPNVHVIQAALKQNSKEGLIYERISPQSLADMFTPKYKHVSPGHEYLALELKDLIPYATAMGIEADELTDKRKPEIQQIIAHHLHQHQVLKEIEHMQMQVYTKNDLQKEETFDADVRKIMMFIIGRISPSLMDRCYQKDEFRTAVKHKDIVTVIQIVQQVYLVRGDLNLLEENPMRVKNVIGKYVDGLCQMQESFEEYSNRCIQLQMLIVANECNNVSYQELAQAFIKGLQQSITIDQATKNALCLQRGIGTLTEAIEAVNRVMHTLAGQKTSGVTSMHEAGIASKKKRQ